MDEIKKFNYKTGSVYIFLLGSKTKISERIKKYNLQDTFANHIALGVVTDKKLTAYHININQSKRGDNFFEESVDSLFVDVDGSLAYEYCSVWELALTANELERVKVLTDSIKSREVLFDYDFEENNKLYCSEFVSIALGKVLEKKYNFHMEQNKVFLEDHLDKAILGKDTLSYIPVDFICQLEELKKVLEWKRKG